MANRTIQLLGQGYGSSPAALTVSINGATVFSGTVPTLNQPAPVLVPLMNQTLTPVVLCSFDVDLAIGQTVPMTYTVTSGTVLLADVNSNNMMVLNPVYSSEQLETLGNPATTAADQLVIYKSVAVPPFTSSEEATLLDPAVSDAEKEAILVAHNCQVQVATGATCQVTPTDPRSNVVIDGVAQTPDHSEFAGGTWWWMVAADSTMSCNFAIPPAV